MPTRLYKSGNGSIQVPSGARFVDSVKLIKATKGHGSNWPNERFQHKFTKPNKMYKVSGRKLGVLIYDRLEEIVGRSGVMKFSSGKVYGLKNGNVFVSSGKGNFLIVGNEPLWDIFKYSDK